MKCKSIYNSIAVYLWLTFTKALIVKHGTRVTSDLSQPNLEWNSDQHFLFSTRQDIEPKVSLSGQYLITYEQKEKCEK